jgi:hypothetical protein
MNTAHGAPDSRFPTFSGAKKINMERFQSDLQTKNQLNAYRQEHHLTIHDAAIMDEIIEAVNHEKTDLLDWFNNFGDSIRVILSNVHAFRKNCEFGFNELAFDKYGWILRPAFLEIEELKFGNQERYGEYSKLSVGLGVIPLWTYGLSCNFGTAGSSYVFPYTVKSLKAGNRL